MTLSDWEKLPPYEQGFAAYWFGNDKTSELYKVACPYKDGKKLSEYKRGQEAAAIAAQEGDD